MTDLTGESSAWLTKWHFVYKEKLRRQNLKRNELVEELQKLDQRIERAQQILIEVDMERQMRNG